MPSRQDSISLFMSDAPIQIRNPEVVRALREVAAQRNQPITQALGELALAELNRLKADKEARYRQRVESIRRRVAEVHELPVIGAPLTDDDLYDEEGLPR
jgi:hypothetical protein